LPAFFAAWSVFWLQESFHADGNPLAPDFQKRASDYFDELLWFTEGLATHRAKTNPTAAKAKI